MSITLTTPQQYDPGHGQSPISVPEVKIYQVDHEIVAKRLILHMQYGTTISGDWIGQPEMPVHSEVIYNFDGMPDGEGGWVQEPDPAYDLFMVSTFPSSTSNLLYDENATALYQYLLDDGRYEGTIT